MAQIALPEMRSYKYDDKLATGSVAAGGTIGILIPPSVVMVIYGLLTETSISALFLAGFIPGILTVARLHGRDRDHDADRSDARSAGRAHGDAANGSRRWAACGARRRCSWW